jgi:long-subunit acyl-CoA synthetase (AMP-forming)
VEDAIKSCDLISEVMVIGEKCKNVYACVTLDPDAAAKIPPDQRLPTVRRKVLDVTSHLAPFQRPKDVLILPDFSVEDGTVTVTLKIRRFRIWEKYGDRIAAFLRENGEEIATRAAVNIASSKIMESLGRSC